MINKCPWCNSERCQVDVDLSGFWVFCRDCLAHGPTHPTREKALAAWNVDKWVSVEDRLPEAWADVLLFGTVKEYPYDEEAKSVPLIEIGTRRRDGSYGTGYYGELNKDGITHWQPLPEAP